MTNKTALREYTPQELAELFQKEAEKIAEEKCQFAVIRATFSGGKGKFLTIEKPVEK